MDNDPNISKRLLQFIQYLGMSLASFAYNCGISQTSVLSGKLTNKAINKILSEYPELNSQWLKYGDGTMFGKLVEKSGMPIPTPQKTKDKRRTKRKPKAIVVSDSVTENESMAKIERKPHRGKMPRPIRDRLRMYMSSLKLSSSEFAKTIGVLESRVSKIDETPDALLCIIYRKYPTVNPQWLEYGNGNMLLGANEICTVRGGKRRAEEWRTGATGYKWVLEKVLEGIPRKEIIREFNRRHEQDPCNYSTRTGKPLSDGILSIWIKNSGIIPPIKERPHPYRKNITDSSEVNELLPQMTVQDILLSIKRQTSLHCILASIIEYKARQLNVADLPICEHVISCEEDLSQTEQRINDTDRAIQQRKDKPINDEILNIWQKMAAITLQPEAIVCVNFPKEPDNRPISVPCDTHLKPAKTKKAFNHDVIKSVLIAIGAIVGIFLLVWIITEFIFPVIIGVLLFISMLFAKK